MSATADQGDDRAWFRTIEETFIRLRGAPLLLSPADWQVARGWREEGIPLRLILDTLEQLFVQRAERGARGRVNSLRYCAPAVEAAWRDMRQLLGGSTTETTGSVPDLQSRLDELAESLPTDMNGRDELMAVIRDLHGTAETVEGRLAELETDWLAAAEAHLTQKERAAIDEQVDSALGRLSGRLSGDERERTRSLLRRRALRRHLGLPELSLFAEPTA
jgi:hypothetical protein